MTERESGTASARFSSSAKGVGRPQRRTVVKKEASESGHTVDGPTLQVLVLTGVAHSQMSNGKRTGASGTVSISLS